MASAFSLNRVQLIGNLGADPDMKTTPSGKTVCTLKIATSDSYKDQSGNWQDITDWHTVTLWERLAERAGQHLKKGSKVFIEGALKTRSYEKDGVTRYITDVLGQSMIIFDQKGGSSNSGGTYPQQQQSSSSYNPPSSQQPNNNPPAVTQSVNDKFVDEFDDDVPF